MSSLREWIRSGAPYVWLNASAVSACILLVVGLLGLIAVRGMGHFWPAAVVEVVYQQTDGTRVTLTGQITEREEVPASRLTESGVAVEAGVKTVERILLKTGNRDLTGEDFRWILAPGIVQQSHPLSMAVLEREEWGAFFGRVIGLKIGGELLDTPDVWSEFMSALDQTGVLREQIDELEKGDIGRVNYRMERLRLDERSSSSRG